MNTTLRLIAGSLMLSAATLGTYAAIPSGYYSTLEGKTGAELKDAVHKVIYPHQEVSSYSALPQYFQYTDVYLSNSKTHRIT